MSEPDKFSNCWNTISQSEVLNQKCSGAAEGTNEVEASGALYYYSWVCALGYLQKFGPPSGECGKM